MKRWSDVVGPATSVRQRIERVVATWEAVNMRNRYVSLQREARLWEYLPDQEEWDDGPCGFAYPPSDVVLASNRYAGL